MTFDEIDDFDSIESEGLSDHEINLSNVYNVKVGGFGQPTSIKTYLCSLSVKDLERDIELYETLSRDKSWPVSQIIQREVDKIRVSDISKDYVLGEGRNVKYFPPLIIAILPKSSDGKISLSLDFNTENVDGIKQLIFDKSQYRSNSKLKDYFIRAQNKSLISGLYVLEVSKVFDFTILCWDKSRYYAIVIDGQHRLDALIKSKKDDSTINDYLQDVVFLDFSSLIKSKAEEFTPVEVVRRVFIDINTNAKRVGIVRQILMDDKDLASLFVQSLVDSVNRSGTDKASNRYIPSLLVDWYGDSLKHTLPHLTGVLSLHQIISDYLIQYNLSSIDDLRSPNKVKNWVKRINDYFLVDKQILENEQYKDIKKLSESFEKYTYSNNLFEEVRSDLDDEFKESSLFSYDYRTLEVAQRTFENLYAFGMVKFFNEFCPYKEVRKIIEDEGGFEPGSTLYKALISSRKKILVSKPLKDALDNIKIKLEAHCSERYFLMYTVLGQKAVFNLLFKRIFANFNKDFTEDKCIVIVEKYLSEINMALNLSIDGSRNLFGKKENLTLTEIDDELIDLGTISTSFWEGIIYEDNKIIYNSQGIQSLSSFIEYVINLCSKIKENPDCTSKMEISFHRQRIKRILKKRFDVLPESDIEEHASRIIEEKQKFIIEYIKAALKLQGL